MDRRGRQLADRHRRQARIPCSLSVNCPATAWAGPNTERDLGRDNLRHAAAPDRRIFVIGGHAGHSVVWRTDLPDLRNPAGGRRRVAGCAGRRRCARRVRSESLRGVDISAHDPRVLAHLPSLREPVLLEQLDCCAEQEPALSFAAGGGLGDRFDQAAAIGCDLRERALEPGSCDPLAAMPLVGEYAGDPPARGRRWVLAVLTGPCLSSSSSGLPYWHQPCANPCSSKTSVACAWPARTSCCFSVRGSLIPRW